MDSPPLNSDPNMINELRLLLAALVTGIAKGFHIVLTGKEKFIWTRILMRGFLCMTSGYATVLLCRWRDIKAVELGAIVGAWAGVELLELLERRLKREVKGDK